MEQSFIFESSHFSHDDLCDRIEITIEIQGTSHGDYSFEFISIINTDECEIEKRDLSISIKDFPPDEQKIIYLRAETIAQKYAHEAYDALMDRDDEHMFESYREDNI
jgi:hypothetical protein